MSDEPWPSTHWSLLLEVRDPRNSAAWTEFTHRYRPVVVQFCQQRFRVQDASCEDVAQDVLLKLMGAMRKFQYDPQKSFRGWLKTVTSNAVRDFLKEEKGRPEASSGGSQIIEVLQNIPADEVTEELSDVLSESLMRDVMAEVERLVHDRVDDTTWQAYELRRKATPAKEVASQLNMKTAAVHKAYSRVKHMLREEVAMLLNQPADAGGERSIGD